MKRIPLVMIALVALLVVGASVVLVRHRAGVQAADAEWLAHRPEPLGDIGSTRSLEILPLVDWHAAREGLATDARVS